MTPSFDLAIFDCDGVLVDSEPLANQVFVEMIREHGFDIDEPAYLRKFSGITLPDRIQTTAQELNWMPPQDFHQIFNERLAILTRERLQPVQGIHELLKSLPVPVCVASNGSREEVDLRLELSGLTNVFGNAIFSGIEVAKPKPAPDVYLAAAKSFDVSPSRCLVVEDSIPGVTAAVQAGMRVYGHAAFTPAQQLKDIGAIPFKDMFELKEILAKEFRGLNVNN
jgi:HAD superfamily hydrolase (TIGR01509 family)